MGNLELPARMSPCLGIFIASLLDESTSSVTGETNGLPLAIAISAENDSARDKGELLPTTLMDRWVAVVAIRKTDPARVSRALMDPFGGDVLKAK